MQGHHSVVLKLMQGHHYYYTVAQCSLGPVSRLHPWHFWWFSAAKRGSHAAIRVFGAPADPSICIWCSRHPLFGDAVFGAARQRVRIKAQRLGVGRGWELRALSQYEDSLPLPCHVVILCPTALAIFIYGTCLSPMHNILPSKLPAIICKLHKHI